MKELISIKDYDKKLQSVALDGDLRLQDVYRKIPYYEMLKKICCYFTFTSFEASVFYMFIKQIGWFSEFKMIDFTFLFLELDLLTEPFKNKKQ